jgi:ribosomal protein S18 acetylase RimI-like enzyme
MLRDGVPADAEKIESIRIAAWQVAYKEFMPADYLAKLDALQDIEGLREMLSSQSLGFSIFVAEENNIVLAFSILGKPRYETSDDTIELWALNVHPRCWRMGFGRELTKKAIASATDSGFRNIELWCIKCNRSAEATYEQAGFLPTGKERTSSTLTGNPIHERHYTKSL